MQLSTDGTFYHSLKWKEVLMKSFHDSPIYLAVKDANGIVGICPGFIRSSTHSKIYSSMPYSDYGGPVIARQCIEQASRSLREHLQRFCSSRGVAYLNISFTNDNETFFGSPLGYVDVSQGVVEIDLERTPSHFIWNRLFSKNRRSKMRRFEGEGYQARKARTTSDLEDFYSLYYRNMKYIGVRPYPYEFLHNMWSLLYPLNLRIWLVAKEDPIGGILVLKDGRRTYWLLAGIDRRRAYAPYPIVNLLLWKEIGAAEEEGCRYVSLGATSSDPNDPYHVQKISFGGLFNQQKVVRYPCSYIGHFLLQARATAATSWRAVRRFLPRRLENHLKDTVGKHFGP